MSPNTNYAYIYHSWCMWRCKRAWNIIHGDLWLYRTSENPWWWHFWAVELRLNAPRGRFLLSLPWTAWWPRSLWLRACPHRVSVGLDVKGAAAFPPIGNSLWRNETRAGRYVLMKIFWLLFYCTPETRRPLTSLLHWIIRVWWLQVGQENTATPTDRGE